MLNQGGKPGLSRSRDTMRILAIEDNDLVADAVVLGLSAAGFAVDRAASAEAAELALATDQFDLLVVDIGLPGANGLTLIRQLRHSGMTIPILMLSARASLANKLEAFDLGADDFLAKPFEQAELAARCRALIKRVHLRTAGELNLGRLCVDISGRQVRINEKPVDLTAREWLVLECLALRCGRIVSKQQLMQAISTWDEELSANAVEVYVSRVRAKLHGAVVIRTIRGLGYRLDESRE
jgi:DNA-binding response OmpR family regulator